ncbi:carboxylesterase/lipase family protein [Yinghuangia soli]|uniref:Carboxylic ester hydrolase n=1 Tax=Yinghuangia soli TaxID=2908204 RepID=A0AA41Q5S5_9ACTN|nr:carboxylesterase family protein [Yinghuangia soli]MCF2532073.1 carboxylesterase family protein [Yinghuangia soli]
MATSPPEHPDRAPRFRLRSGTRSGVRPGTRAATCAAAAAALVATLLAAPQAAAHPAGPDRGAPVAAAKSGLLRGQAVGGAEQFLGVPYAAPPVGALRFRAPAAVPRWSGTRDATAQSAACIQFAPVGVDPAYPRSEDCLALDLYRPRGARPGAKLPVIVWIHGGAWQQGTGVQFAGRTTADTTGAIVLSINYRLGALGYLGLPGFDAETPEGSGNWGTLDQIAALRWVRDNATAFGGDAGNVTVTGQSAGSGSVCALLGAPAAKGLFAKAVLQSGPCSFLSARPLADAQAQGAAFAASLGCPDAATAAACLRNVPIAALTAAGMNLPPLGPAAGGKLLPRAPYEAITSGQWNKVPVIIGNTRSEGKLFALGQAGISAEEYTAYVGATYGSVASKVLARYPVSGYPTPFHALSAVLTDSSWACQTQVTAESLSRQVPTYQYEFDDPASPPLRGLDIPGLDTGNAHSAELAYLFDFTEQGRPFTAEQAKLADRMKRAWAAFAWYGTPNGPGLAPWLPLTGRGDVLKFGPSGDRMFRDFADEHQCGFWSNPAA